MVVKNRIVELINCERMFLNKVKFEKKWKIFETKLIEMAE